MYSGGIGAGQAARVAAEVLAQDARLGDGIEGGIPRAVDLAADHLVLPPALEFHPLHAARAHAPGHVADEGIVRLIEVIVGVEDGALVKRHGHFLPLN
jgi:hypothetical protein